MILKFICFSTELRNGGDRVGAVHCDPTAGMSLHDVFFSCIILTLFPLLQLSYQFTCQVGMLRVSALRFLVLSELHLSDLSPWRKISSHLQHEKSPSWPELFTNNHMHTHPFPDQLFPAIFIYNILRKWLSVLTCAACVPHQGECLRSRMTRADVGSSCRMQFETGEVLTEQEAGRVRSDFPRQLLKPLFIRLINSLHLSWCC